MRTAGTLDGVTPASRDDAAGRGPIPTTTTETTMPTHDITDAPDDGANAADAPAERTGRAILRLLYDGDALTRQDIARRLELSLPTVGAGLRDLERRGAVRRAEPRASTGGRRPLTYRFDARHRIAIGAAIRSAGISCVAVDLAGRKVAERRTTIAARADDVFYRRAARIIDDFAHACADDVAPPLGVGLAFPAHVNAASSLDYRAIAGRIEPPVTPVERYRAHAFAECWARPRLRDAVCLFLGAHIGSAVVVDGEPHTAALEHMQLAVDGPRCECGSTGCLNVYCSSSRLAEDGESLPGFFGVLEQGEVHHRDRMRAWLDSLGHAIANVHTILSADVVLCGPIAGFLDDGEIARLQDGVRARPAAARRRPDDAPPGQDGRSATPRVIRGLCEADQDATGAALAVVRAHLDAIGCAGGGPPRPPSSPDADE